MPVIRKNQNPSNMNIRSISACSLAAALSMSALSPLSAANQEAKPISEVAPAYSLDLRESGVQGEVVVGFTITAAGRVADPVVISTTNAELDKATLAAVRQWKFAPAMNNGVAVSQKAVLPVAFRISDLPSNAGTRVVVSDSRPASLARNSSSTN
jgi:TonB family protein